MTYPNQSVRRHKMPMEDSDDVKVKQYRFQRSVCGSLVVWLI